MSAPFNIATSRAGGWKNLEKRVIDRLDRDTLIQVRIGIEETLDRIKGQLDQSKADLVTTGEYADPHWYRAAETAKRILGRKLQMIQARLGEIRRAEREQNRATADARLAAKERRRATGPTSDFWWHFQRVCVERFGQDAMAAVHDETHRRVAVASAAIQEAPPCR